MWVWKFERVYIDTGGSNFPTEEHAAWMGEKTSSVALAALRTEITFPQNGCVPAKDSAGRNKMQRVIMLVQPQEKTHVYIYIYIYLFFYLQEGTQYG